MLSIYLFMKCTKRTFSEWNVSGFPYFLIFNIQDACLKLFWNSYGIILNFILDGTKCWFIHCKKFNLTLQFKLCLFMHNCAHSFNSSGIWRRDLNKEEKYMCTTACFMVCHVDNFEYYNFITWLILYITDFDTKK